MAEIKLIPPFTTAELVEELYQMIEKNQFQEDGNVYLQISRGAQPRNHVYESDLQPTYFANACFVPKTSCFNGGRD